MEKSGIAFFSPAPHSGVRARPGSAATAEVTDPAAGGAAFADTSTVAWRQLAITISHGNLAGPHGTAAADRCGPSLRDADRSTGPAHDCRDPQLRDGERHAGDRPHLGPADGAAAAGRRCASACCVGAVGVRERQAIPLPSSADRLVGHRACRARACRSRAEPPARRGRPSAASEGG